mgnify:CR=1 FL=1
MWACNILCDPRFSDRERAKNYYVMWAIWMSHNRRTHDQEIIDLDSSVRRIQEDLPLLDIPGQAFIPMSGDGWRPPEGNYIKINTDAVTHRDTDTAGIGGLARSSSAFLGAWCKPHLGVTDPFIAEVLSIREGTIFARLRGYTHVQLESDCLEAVNLWNSRYTDRSVIAPILDEIGELAFSFTSFFAEILSIYSSSIMAVQRIPEIKITSRFVDHLATTTSTEASRRRAAVIAPPSPEPGTTCCSRQSGSRRAKAP